MRAIDAGHVVQGRYRLISLLGEGGMGEVWRAQHVQLGSDVAVKLLRPEALTESGVARFDREARLTGAIRHRNVVGVQDHGNDKGIPFIVMEYLHGENLGDRLKRAPQLPLDELIQYALGALAGLSAVHAVGIIHRDLKPANIFLAEDADGIVPKVLDFGISRASSAISRDQSEVSLTQTHQVLGTPYYMSPEQVRSAKALDARSDIFSMGVILYEALAGRRPFEGPNAAAVIASIMVDAPPPLPSLRPDLPPQLVSVIDRALARDPDSRFPTARAMRDALAQAAVQTGHLRTTLVDSASEIPTAPLHAATTVPATDVGASGRRSGMRAGLAVVVVLAAIGVTAGIVTVTDFGGLPVIVDNPRTVDAAAVVVGQPDAAPVVPPVIEAIRIGPVGTREALALRWRDLPRSALRDQLRIAPLESQFALVGTSGVDLEEARELARTLGVTAEPIAAPSQVLTPTMLRVSGQSLNVRDAPGSGGRLVRDMRPGTLIVALHGLVDGIESSLGEGAWSYVVVDPRHAGWSSSNLMERYRGCAPPIEQVVENVPEARRDEVRGDLAISTTRVRSNDEILDGMLAIARDVDEVKSYVGVYTVSGDCSFTQRSFHDVNGVVEQVFLVDTAQAGGETLLVMGWRQTVRVARTGETTWSAYRLTRDTPVWEARLASDESLSRERRRPVTIRPAATTARIGADQRLAGYWVLEIEHPLNRRQYFIWNGRTLVEDPATVVANWGTPFPAPTPSPPQP